MSDFVAWIAAQADEIPKTGIQNREDERQSVPGRSQPEDISWQTLPAHNFPQGARQEPVQATATEPEWDRDPDLWLYRKKTTALLRRYMRWSLEAGRVPSLLGRELFRARITAYTSTTFEARVIFLHDVEKCLDRLQGFDRKMIGRIVLQEYDHEAASRILQCDRRTIERRLPEVIDELSEAFLKAELLVRMPEPKKPEEAL